MFQQKIKFEKKPGHQTSFVFEETLNLESFTSIQMRISKALPPVGLLFLLLQTNFIRKVTRLNLFVEVNLLERKDPQRSYSIAQLQGKKVLFVLLMCLSDILRVSLVLRILKVLVASILFDWSMIVFILLSSLSSSCTVSLFVGFHYPLSD